MSSFITASLEIRAPRAHVASIAGRVDSAASWLWAPVQVANVGSSRDLPDGTRQLIVSDGDKIRDKVIEATVESVVLESELRPRRQEIPGRHLRYELTFDATAGASTVTMGLSFIDREAPTQTAAIRKWRRHAEQCLQRLSDLAVQPADIPESTDA